MRNSLFLPASGSLLSPSRRLFCILGIESSCDDSGVSVIDFGSRRVISDRRSTDGEAIARLGGVIPHESARHHRRQIPKLIADALRESKLRSSDISAVAVSTRPGIVQCLKAGIEYAFSFARDFHRPLIPVHHMRAHALVARLSDPGLHFPFVALLISGAHFIICLVQGPADFRLLSQALGGSPGECMDKLARELGMTPVNGHYAAALEQMAKMCSLEGHKRYKITLPAEGTELDFNKVKERYMPVIIHWRNCFGMDEKQRVADLCASIQHAISQFITQPLHSALSFLASKQPDFASNPETRRLVVAGGVASNAFILEQIRQCATVHRFTLSVPPPALCTDNGVMIAWAGAEIFDRALSRRREVEERLTTDSEGEDGIFWPNALPSEMLRCKTRSNIGPKMAWWQNIETNEEKAFDELNIYNRNIL